MNSELENKENRGMKKANLHPFSSSGGKASFFHGLVWYKI